MVAKLCSGVPLLVFGLLLGVPSLARADLPPPNTQGCSKLKAGDACMDDAMKPGVCTADKCTVNDYSDGSPPGTKIVDCLVCKPSASSSSSAGSGSGGGSSSSGGGGCAMVAAAGGSALWLGAGFALTLAWRRRRARRASSAR